MKRWISVLLLLVLCLSLTPEAFADDGIPAEVPSLGLEMVWNDRELGGYVMADGRRIKEGLLLHSGRLCDATPEDVELLSSKYHVRMIADLRNDGEVAAKPDAEIPGAELRQFVLYGTKDEEGFDNPVYIRYLVTQTAKTGYKGMFDALLETEEGAFLWHCKSGKDRTGLAAMLILTALGADEDTIFYDFLLTNAVNEAEPDMDGAGPVKEEDMRLAIDYLTETYGSVMGYITDALGVSEADIKVLQDRYLTAE